jgi:hypothetical protein
LRYLSALRMATRCCFFLLEAKRKADPQNQAVQKRMKAAEEE